MNLSVLVDRFAGFDPCFGARTSMTFFVGLSLAAGLFFGMFLFTKARQKAKGSLTRAPKKSFVLAMALDVLLLIGAISAYFDSGCRNYSISDRIKPQELLPAVIVYLLIMFIYVILGRRIFSDDS